MDMDMDVYVYNWEILLASSWDLERIAVAYFEEGNPEPRRSSQAWVWGNPVDIESS